MIKIEVLGEPVAQGRPRATTRNGKTRMYDPEKSRDYKDYVRLVAAQNAPIKPISGAVRMVLYVYRPIPKSFSKKKREKAVGKELRPTTKPDIDNYVKGIKDALKGIIWNDDSQVVEIIAAKWYSENPGIEIMIEELQEE